MACRNAELGKLRAHKRQALLEATVKELEKVREMVDRGDLRGAGEIGVRAVASSTSTRSPSISSSTSKRRFDFSHP